MLRAMTAFILGAICAEAAYASDWYYVSLTGVSPNRHVVFVETSSMRDLGNSRFLVWETDYNERATGTPAYAYTKSQYIWDCRSRTYQFQSDIAYAPNGEVVDTGSNAFARVTPIAPDTSGDSQLRFICGERNLGFKIDDFDPLRSGKVVLLVQDRTKNVPPN